MATDEERRYTVDDPHPAHENLSSKVLEYIYGKPDGLPELPDPPEDEKDPFIHGGRIGAEDDSSPRREEDSYTGTDDSDHHPAVEEFIGGDLDELPELPDPSENGKDPFIHGGRIGVEDDE